MTCDLIAVTLSDNNTIIDVNDNFLSFTGYSRKELNNRNFCDLCLHKNDSFSSEPSFQRKNYKALNNSLTGIRSKKGNTLYCFITSYIQNINGLSVRIANIRSVENNFNGNSQTEPLIHLIPERQNRILEISKQHNSRFEQRKFEEMGQMLRAIAHHWRQPLNSLGLLVQDIPDAYNSNILDKQYIREFENLCMKNVLAMSETIDQFCSLFSSYIESEEFDTAESIIEVAALSKKRLQEKNIELSVVQISENENGYNHKPALVIGIRRDFIWIIQSLICNSEDAIEKRTAVKPDHKGEICIRIKKDSSSISISVADNGAGIDKKILSRIFEPYFTTSKNSGKTGNSLFIAKMLIENHFNGSIHAFTRASGAEIVIILPAVYNAAHS